MTTCVNLWEVYTALWTERSAERISPRNAIEASEPRVRLQSAVNLLNQQPRLVLLGEAGSGKSTFINFVVLCLAGERLKRPDARLQKLRAPLPDDDGKPGKRQSWKHGALLPIKIILRDFAASEHLPVKQRGTVQHLLNFFADVLAEWQLSACLPFVTHQLEDGAALVLFDGVDEVPETDGRRTQVQQVIEACAMRYDRCRMLVTSRTYAYDTSRSFAGFTNAKLSPFTDGQIRWFVDRWYAYIAETKRREKHTAEEFATSLKTAIFADHRLEEFARRPLLLTLMTVLHEWKSGDLPNKPADLYREVTELLLARWEREKFGVDAAGNLIRKEPSLSDMLKVGKDRLLDAVKALAFEAHQAQPDATGTADIAENILYGRLLDISRNREEISEKRLMRYLSQRAGLLMPRNDGYTFPHRSFQEYLAA